MTTTADTIDAIAAGQRVTCTITKLPKAEGARKTIERLMRRDPDHKRGLARAQHLRKRRLNRYIRGNRLWTSREKAARVVYVAEGRSWTMPFTPDIGPDLKSVAGYVNIEQR